MAFRAANGECVPATGPSGGDVDRQTRWERRFFSRESRWDCGIAHYVNEDVLVARESNFLESRVKNRSLRCRNCGRR